jgi:hypothetical protein
MDGGLKLAGNWMKIPNRGDYILLSWAYLKLNLKNIIFI